MLTPEQLARLPASVVELWQQVEEDTLADMCRRISKMDGVTDTAAWQAWRLEQTRLFRRDLTKRLAQMLGRSETEVRKLLSDAGTQTLAADDAIYKLVGKNPLPPNESPALSNLLNAGARQTQGSFVNITATTANTATGQFERTLDRAWLQTSSGAFDYKTAVRQAVSDLADKGLEAIEYPSGHTDTLEVAVRRAVLTGVNQTAGKLQTAHMNEMGCEFVEVTAHAGARPSHAEWQGKVYHRGGAVQVDGTFYPDFETATGYGTGEGLCGWNCRHNFYPYYPEISERVYSDERLAELDARNIEYGGKMYTRYEINQMQRAMERRVRKCKRQFVCEDAAGLDTTQSAVKLKNAREQLKNFAYETGGRVDSARTSTHEFGRVAAGKATWTSEHYHKEWLKSIGAQNSELNTLAKYYEGKYNNSPAYQLLKQYSSDVKSGWISPNATLENYLKQYDRIQSEIVGQTTAGGTVVTGQRAHFMQRVLGTAVDPKKYAEDHRIIRRSGVEIDAIKDALLSPEKVDPPVTRADGKRSVRYIGKDCLVTVNPDTGELIQTNPRRKKK